MNVFEICLLIDSLVKSGKSEDAKRLAEFVRLNKETFDLEDAERDNKVFDIVLNLNMLKADKNLADLLGGGGA